MKILQANLQRKARAHDEAYATALKKGVDILVAGEPNIKTVSGGSWIKDETANIAVLLINRKIGVHAVTRGMGRVTLDLEAGFRLTCCYISPNVTMEVFSQRAEEVFGTVEGGKEVVVVGDINAKSPEWGSPVWDAKELWTELMSSKEMEVLNDGKEPTWRRGQQSRYIDVTCATREVAEKIKDCSVLPEESLSDHGLIFFEVQGGRPKATQQWGPRPIIDKERLTHALREEFSRTTEGPDQEVEIVKRLKRAQDAGEIKRTRRQGELPYWWNGDIERARNNCIAARRTLTRHRSQENTGEEQIAREEVKYKEKRRTMASPIRSSKRAPWKDLCEELEQDI